jgi:predicted DNA-binding protein with PD1-like motif
MTTLEIKPAEYLIVKIQYGEDILQSLSRMVSQRGIRNGLILSGVGSTSSYHVHVVKSTNLPPGNTYWKEENPFDVVSISGLVIDGRLHAHIVLSDRNRTIAGHLEEGCRVLTFCIVTIAILEQGVKMADLDRFAVPGK